MKHIEYSYIFLVAILLNYNYIFITKKFYFNFLTALFLVIFFSLNILNAYKNPGRISVSINEHNKIIKFPYTSGGLKVDEYTYHKFKTLRDLAISNGWKKGNYLIDLTGRDPFNHLALGAKVLTHSWINSALEPHKSFNFFYSKVNKNKIKNSWLIIKESKGFKFNKVTYEKYGINKFNYLKVGELSSKKNIKFEPYKYSLWKPK